MPRGLRKQRKGRSRVSWFARGGDVARVGPFNTQVDAVAHIMVHAPECAINRWPYTECDCDLRPIEGAFVWPEPKL